MHRSIFCIVAVLSTVLSAEWSPCSEVDRTLRYPCRCSVSGSRDDPGDPPLVSMDCDKVVFAGEFPPLPYGAPIVSFRQRWSGHQALPTQIFSELNLPLRHLDFTGNSVRRLTERLVTGLQSTLTELILADNLLGDNLNPIFSTSEFHGLTHLSFLDLTGNSIRGIEEGILKGCDNLVEFRLDRNNLMSVPSTSLNGPRALKVLSLKDNRITKIRQGAFLSQRSLEQILLQGNMLANIDGGAFSGLTHLKSLGLGRNRLSRLNSDVFQGAERLEKLDLSENFISEFPSVALKAFTALKNLNLSTNMLKHLDNGHLGSMVSLQALDISRNNIANLAPGTFLGLRQLRYLDIGVNALRTVEDDAFEGLDNLETLLLRDNNILLIPASALGRLPRLSSIHLGYNRVTAVSSDILRSMAEHVSSLVLARNVIRELPPAAFQHFKYLTHLDMNGNLLNVLNAEIFSGLENTLEYLSVAQNRILNLAGTPMQFSRLWYLDISGNQLSEISRNAFTIMPNLSFLNMSRNPHLNKIPHTLFYEASELVTVDLSYNGMKSLAADLFSKSENLENIYLSNNAIQEIPEKAFSNMRNLTLVDLSNNHIMNIRQGAFVNVMSIQQLYLNGNQLNAFKGEFFNTGTSLEVLDLADNELSYLFPSSFRIHPRLVKLIASRNKFNFFPAELIASLQYLEHIDLSGNGLKSVEELDFARLPKLRTLLLSNNELESISEMAFHNSTQLQVLDLGYNNLDRLGERTFEGLARLEMLNLEHNILTELPDTIFDRTRLQMLENINLAHNLFEVPPLKALQKQYFFVSSVDMSHNKLVDIPADDSIMVNIKKLDLSYNPLSRESVANVLGEPKTVRDLNLAGTGITEVFQLETPFLHNLNLSHNNIANLNDKTFERTTLLESLDISHNKISDLSYSISKIWGVLKSLQYLNMSDNPIIAISQGDLDGLESLRLLSIENLEDCSKMERNAFRPLVNLARLDAYNYPKLGYLDVQGILQSLPVLEKLDIEIKDAAVGSDQLQSALHPRLQELGIRGPRLKSISSSALAGLKSQSIAIRLRNTSLTSIPSALLFPLPRSSRVTLDVTGSQLTSLQPQLLVALDDRKADLSMLGLSSNPIHCDCAARALRRWLPISHMTNIKCSTPDYLAGQLLVEIGDDELTCDPRKPSTKVTPAPTLSVKPSRMMHKPTAEPEIIWSVAPTSEEKPNKKNVNIKGAPITSQSAVNNDDTLIIGIVGGVVAFIAILVIIICIVRLKMSSAQYRGGPLANGPMGPMTALPPLYAVPPYGSAYAATLPPNASVSTGTLPHKMHSAPASIRPAYATMGRMPYYAQNAPGPQPYFVSLAPHDEKIYR